MNDNVSISIKNVKKKYRLGQIGGGSLQSDLQSWWARKRGKEDPNSKIDTDQRLIGQSFMALNGVNLEIKKGEAIGIIGKNGAGKSTLLKLLCRVTAPTEGTIDIYGRITSMLEVGTGFHGEMTGRENVYMNGAILGMTKAEIDRKIDKIIEFSEVGDFIDTPVKRYSSGMYVKLAFSVAAHLDSEIMIMDEVLAVGDMAFQKKCLDKMSDASRSEGKTVLYVSHNMNTIRQLCDRCVVLDQGRVIFDGNVEKAIEVYLGIEGTTVYKTHYELEHLERPNDFGKRIRFKELNYYQKKVAQYTEKEVMDLKIEFIADEGNENLYIVVVIKSKDNSSICMSGISQKILFKEGINTVNLKIPLDLLVESTYRLHLELVCIDPYGRSRTLDNPFISFPFKVNGAINSIVWPTRYYGWVRQEGIKAEIISQ